MRPVGSRCYEMLAQTIELYRSRQVGLSGTVLNQERYREMHNAVFCAGFVTGLVLGMVILNPGRMTQKSLPDQATIPISGSRPVAREVQGPHPFPICLASTGRCMDVDAPPSHTCLLLSKRCAATGKVGL